jgi:hypothetical protein
MRSGRYAPRSASSEAEAILLRALELARTQSAKLLELRIATDLAAIWQHRSSQLDDARNLLSSGVSSSVKPQKLRTFEQQGCS